MIIAVPFAGADVSQAVAKVMVASCKAAMPNVEVIQLTDVDTEPLEGVDGVIRRHRGDSWPEFFLRHMITMPYPEVLKLDYDVIVQRSVEEVFQLPFDLALTRRIINDTTCGPMIRVKNPHNHGVMFMRHGAKPFFEYAYREFLGIQDDNGWMDVSYILEEAAAQGTCRWIQLPGERYNYTPKHRDEDVSNCAIVHYKGNRKWWMVGAENEAEARKDGEQVLRMVEERDAD